MRTLTLALLLATQLPALPLTIYGDSADTFVSQAGINPAFITQTQGQNGQNGGSSPRFNYSMVFVFQLPALARNQSITSAAFSPYLLSAGSPFATDLYGIAYRTSPNVLASDWYSGPGDPSNTLIQSSFVNLGMPRGRIATSTAGNTALVNYLNAQYTAGATGGDFIFLRLSSNSANIPNANVNFYYAADIAPFMVNAVPNTTLARWQEELSPLLNINVEDTAVPEPATFLTAALGLGAAALRRRSR